MPNFMLWMLRLKTESCNVVNGLMHAKLYVMDVKTESCNVVNGLMHAKLYVMDVKPESLYFVTIKKDILGRKPSQNSPNEMMNEVAINSNPKPIGNAWMERTHNLIY
jgi:hypothetical protein